jgi:hypothetical protein
MSNPDFYRQADEQELKHCLIDLHQVGDSNSAKAAFMTKWAAFLERLLRYPAQHTDEDAVEAMADKDEAEEEAEALRTNIHEALDELKADPVKQKNVIEAKRLLTEALSSE